MSGKIRKLTEKIIARDWSTLKKLSYEYQTNSGDWEVHTREAYDRGDGATILLYNPSKQTVILTRQFRIPTFLNKNPDGHLIEACAGKLDEEAEACVRREALEETGYKIEKVEKVFEAYMSPGSVTELIHFFTAAVSDDMKVSTGGGVDHEQENIEVLELPFEQALVMIKKGEIKDAKTIMLLQHAALSGLLVKKEIQLPG